jgi:ABC-type uncharacterized transport system permease subunit
MPFLYFCALFYALGTLMALGSLYQRNDRLQKMALGSMVIGFVLNTIWIGVVCTRTGHPPLTNLPEAAAFMAWTVFAVELFLFIRYRVHAASFFVYPLVLMLITITMVVREPFAHLDRSHQSRLFTAHLLLSTLGVAALLIGLAFLVLAQIQQRSLKSKERGRLFEWIPSLQVCELVSYRALAIGFSIYTLGILTGILWSYRTTAGFMSLRSKEIGALTAWVFFAILLQAQITGNVRPQRNLIVSAAAFISIVIAIFGIHHG